MKELKAFCDAPKDVICHKQVTIQGSENGFYWYCVEGHKHDRCIGLKRELDLTRISLIAMRMLYENSGV